MLTVTRTIMIDLEGVLYVSLHGIKIVPKCITRFSPGTRVQVCHSNKGYAVMPLNDSILRIFGEETWQPAV